MRLSPTLLLLLRLLCGLTRAAFLRVMRMRLEAMLLLHLSCDSFFFVFFFIEDSSRSRACVASVPLRSRALLLVCTQILRASRVVAPQVVHLQSDKKFFLVKNSCITQKLFVY
jgi:hypothetical protein